MSGNEQTVPRASVAKCGADYRVTLADVELILSRHDMVALMASFYEAVRNELWTPAGAPTK